MWYVFLRYYGRYGWWVHSASFSYCGFYKTSVPSMCGYFHGYAPRTVPPVVVRDVRSSNACGVHTRRRYKETGVEGEER